MKLNLENLTDRGCWISDDRVNAFISQAEQGIAEIGYHGTQPVSRNSRMFVGAGKSVLSVCVRKSDGSVHPITFGEVDWSPSSISVIDSECWLQIVAHGRAIQCTVQPTSEAEVEFEFNLRSLNNSVQGIRDWREPVIEESSIDLSCRDRILLNDWLTRTGPYAGDFLIPEPTRRNIFARKVRSGQATVDDLRPEFREVALPIYDAEVLARIGGRAWRIDRDGDIVRFSAIANAERPAEFLIVFGDQQSDLDVGFVQSQPYQQSATGTKPYHGLSLEIPGHSAVEQFVRTIPELVESAIVQDVGMPRATPGAYYWIWAWDSLVTGMEMLRWGDSPTTRRMVEFFNRHRDEDGLIPMRWTRSLDPLDTPPRGALEFLFISFAYQQSVETGERDLLDEAYPLLVQHFLELCGRSDAAGMFTGSGFYPDMPAKFGRSEASVVAMEVGAHFAFCRLLENVALARSDREIADRARDAADRIGAHFLDRFWDDEVGFLVDGFDADTKCINKTYPLFTLLFLQSALGIPLVRSKLSEMGDFCSKHFLGAFGTALLPVWDRNRMNEDATASWYPHWDVYLLKVLRRAGCSKEIVQWLGNVERVLAHLGYCPEFIKLPDLDSDKPTDWRDHGAASNLNCVTGWLRAILEGVFGLEVDPGGLTIIPLSLPVEGIKLDGFTFRGGRWNLSVVNGGEYLEALVIDGIRWEGIAKIPERYYDRNNHTLDVVYGSEEPALQFRELINAVLLDASGSDEARKITVRPLGSCDVLFFSRGRPALTVDGSPAAFDYDEQSQLGRMRLRSDRTIELTLTFR